MFRRRVLPALVCALALQGCGTPPRPAPSPAPGSLPAPGAPAAKAPDAGLAIERAWLQSWFSGTPVVITQQADGPVSVEVPREFSFDANSSKINPPLAAVLDKVAQSMRRTGARLSVMAAPGDAAAASPLATQRANALRKHLVNRGVPAGQLGSPSTTGSASVQLRMERAAP